MNAVRRGKAVQLQCVDKVTVRARPCPKELAVQIESERGGETEAQNMEVISPWCGADLGLPSLNAVTDPRLGHFASLSLFYVDAGQFHRPALSKGRHRAPPSGVGHNPCKGAH